MLLTVVLESQTGYSTTTDKMSASRLEERLEEAEASDVTHDNYYAAQVI